MLVGSDHSGLGLKETILRYLLRCGVEAMDMGEANVPSDYPDVAERVCREVLLHFTRGILVCKTGIGMSIVANRIPGIRAALCTTVYQARMAREHNDSNVLCLGESSLRPLDAVAIVEAWLAAEFTGEERHVRRLRKIDEILSSR